MCKAGFGLLDCSRLSHAYIVSGGLADTLAMAVVCSGLGGARPCMSCAHCGKASNRVHPDITVLDKLPDKRAIVVEQVRELKHDVLVVPNESEKKAYIINDADLMNINAQNAFLQILEEPPGHAVFILRTGNPAALLPTVRSRCVEARAQPAGRGGSGGPGAPHGAADPPGSPAAEMAEEFFSALERGNAPLTRFMFKLEKLDKDAFGEFLGAARARAASLLRADISGAGQVDGPDRRAKREVLACAERAFVRAGEMLELNVGTGHISGMICASIKLESGYCFDRDS